MRRGWYRYSKLGRGRRKKMKWRRQKGRHGKMREHRKGADKSVSIGYGTQNRKSIVIIRNINDVRVLKENKEVLIARTIGKRKRIEIAKKAKELGIKIINLREKDEK